MSVWRKRISGLAAVAMLSGVMVGCGGGGLDHLPAPDPTPINIDGGVPTVEATNPTTVTAGDNPTTILVTPSTGGDPIQATVPAGISVGAGESVAIIPSGTEFIKGLTGGARSPGDVKINGKASGAHVVNGKLVPAIALPSGTYVLDAEGPFTIRQANSILTIQRVRFTFQSNGHTTSLPSSLSGSIPGNGSNNWQNSITAGFTPAYQSGTATLTITHSNGTLNRTVPVVDGTATFTDFANDPQSHIPGTGVDLVNFTHVLP